MRPALRRLRARRSRTVVAALGIFAASAMLGTAVTVGYGLSSGFDRAADRADLPDVLVRFGEEDQAAVDRRVRALPNLAGRAYRFELAHVPLIAGDHASDNGAVQAVGLGRRGYAVVAGRDLSGRRGEVVVERGVAREWGLRVGGRLDVGDARLRVVGVAISPDNVAFPLASAPRVYVARSELGPDFARAPRVNMALVWLRDPSNLDSTLVQARVAGYGLQDVRFLTRRGVRTLIDGAAGIVIALLVGFSVVALASAGLMLAASARAEVQRRLATIGILRALGFGAAGVTAQHGLDAAVVALPAGAVGLGVGALAGAGPTDRLLEALNELGPGAALLWPLLGCLVGVVGLVAGSAAWPAWRAARRPPVQTLRAGDLSLGAGGPGIRFGGGFVGLGMRLPAARRGRLAATVTVLAASAGVVLLLLALASLLVRLRDDPATVGKRYQVSASYPVDQVARLRAVPGVAAAAPRYVVDAADSFALGESLRVVAYPGDHTRFEGPPLASGRRVRGPGEAEVGQGLADAVGAGPGSTLALALPNGREARFRVVGVVRAIDNDGRVAYTQADRLLRAEPGLGARIAVRLRPGADRGAVVRRLEAIGADPRGVAAATSRNGSFLGVLATLLRVVALVDGVVCLYVLAQVLALTARERRSTLAVLRAVGAGRRELALVLAGAALLVAALAAPAAVVLERLVLGPAVSRLGESYVALPLATGAADIVLVVAGLGVLALGAAVVATARVAREPVVAGLRGEA